MIPKGLYLLGAAVNAATNIPDVYTQVEQAAEDVQQKVAVVSKNISPWLWILSIGGFSMAVLNRYQIGKMFGSFKSMRVKLWH